MKEINVYIYRKNRKKRNIEKMNYTELLFKKFKEYKKEIELNKLFRIMKSTQFITKENPIESIKKIGGVCYTYDEVEVTICFKNEQDKENIDGKTKVMVNNVTAYINKKEEVK